MLPPVPTVKVERSQASGSTALDTIACCLIMVAVLFPAPALAEKRAVRELRRDGLHLARTGKYDEALDCFRSALKANPKYADVFADIGAIHMQKEEYSTAIKNFDRALELDDHNLRAYSFRGFCRAATKDYRGAIRDYTREILLSPSDAYSFGNRAEAYRAIGDTRSEKKDLERMRELKLSPESQSLWVRGKLLVKNGMYDDAIKEFSKAIAQNPQCFWAYYWRGEVNRRINRLKAAADDATAACRLEPKSGLPLRLLSEISYEEQRFDEAIRWSTRAIALNPHDVFAYEVRARAYKARGQLKETLSDYEKILEYDPQNVTIRLSRAAIFQTIGDTKRALSDYTDALRFRPRLDAILLPRAALYERLGSYHLAINDLTSVIANNSVDEDAYAQRGAIYAKTGQNQLALADLTKAIALDPKNAWRNYRVRASVYEKLGRKRDALLDRHRASEAESTQ